MWSWIMKAGLLFGMVILLAGCNGDVKKKEGGENDAAMNGIEGTWNGSIQIPNQPLPISISFEEDEQLTGSISISVQGVKGYPLSDIKIDKSDISFAMKIQGQHITFDGTIEKESIEGTFTQNGQSFPFELKKGKADTAEKEEGKGEFLTVNTSKGKLYGEVEIPKGEGPFPIMIIIPGSGPTDRDGNSAVLPGKNNSLKLMAEKLAEQGIATLRYGKRGVGKNQTATIPEKDIRFNQFVKDAKAWVELLEKDNQFSEVGIIGHSQGSLVGMLAAQKTGVDAFVSVAGAGRSIDNVLYDQLKEKLPENLQKESKTILEKLKKGEHVEDMSKELQRVFRPSVQSFLSSWMQYNPAEEIKKLDIPVLIVNGKRDLQVSVSEAKILYEAKSAAELLLIPKMNHVLKEAPKDQAGNIQTYSNPDLPLADGLMKGIVTFLVDKLSLTRAIN